MNITMLARNQIFGITIFLLTLNSIHAFEKDQKNIVIQSASDKLLASVASDITGEDIDEAIRHAQEQLKKRKDLEKQLKDQGLLLDPGIISPGGRHQLFPDTRDQIVAYEDMQTIYDETTKFLIQKKNLSYHDTVYGLGNVPTMESSQEGSSLTASCSDARREVHCLRNVRYRSHDGSCNNRENSAWGRANTCLSRLFEPRYADFQSSPRVSQDGSPLPHPREVSNLVHRQPGDRPAYMTHLFMQWGQFLSHDISFTPNMQMDNQMMVECCPKGPNSTEQRHPECFPLEIPSDDEFYSKFGTKCLNFLRSATCPTCKLGPREQVNQVTSFIDLSQVYGNSESLSKILGPSYGGVMYVMYDNKGKEIPPSNHKTYRTDQCSIPSEHLYCFQTGDVRGNQHPGLLSLHILFLREHNRIAKKLKDLNGKWDDEQIYQETRRILGAVAQVITYKEFLPTLIGEDAMREYYLKVLDNGYTEYDPNVDPSVLNEFSTAAFRGVGHTMIGKFYEIFSSGHSRQMSLNDHYFYPFGFYNGQMEQVIRGLLDKTSEEFDPFVVDEARNHLYQVRDENGLGNDLVAFDIQRGRDHGIAGYIDYIEKCFGERISTFEELDGYMPKEQRLQLSSLYKHVKDIDLLTGGMSERAVWDGFIGKTFSCIIAQQFHRLKFGDRFYFEHGKQIGTFTPGQLATLRNATIANIICRNIEDIQLIRHWVMKEETSSSDNEFLNCEQIPDLDLSEWQEY